MKTAGTHMGSEHKVTVAQRDAKVLELAKGGRTFRQIADDLHFEGSSGAYKAFKRALKATIQPVADEYRALHLARYEHIIRANWIAMTTGNTESARVIVLALKGIADLLGLNAPKEVRVAYEMQALADRVAESTGLNAADIIAEAERIVAAVGVPE